MIVAVIGGGPAGMMAAGTAAENGHTVTLFEQNEKLGKKLYITGKGRCNVTNAAERDGFFRHVLHNPRFLYSAWANFDNTDTMALVERMGTPLKTERGGRVFPVSDKSSDILRAMERFVRASGATVRLNTPVRDILTEDGCVTGVLLPDGAFPCDAVIVATGGAFGGLTGARPLQSASASSSPVRMRTARSRSQTKILPSPILPVPADCRIASTTASTCSSVAATSSFSLGRKSTTYSAPR